MSMRSLFTHFHVVVSCGVLLLWLAALAARISPWRRHHALIGRVFVVLVVASSVSAVGLAVDARNRFGAAFMLQPLVLCLSAGAQFLPSRRVARVLGWVGLLVAAAVLEGFVRLLAARQLVDVMAFAWAALALAVLATDDLRTRQRLRWRAHGHRMLAVGWFYLAELGIFVFDPQPSVIAWVVAAIVPAGGAWWMHRRPGDFGRARPVVVRAALADA